MIARMMTAVSVVAPLAGCTTLRLTAPPLDGLRIEALEIGPDLSSWPARSGRKPEDVLRVRVSSPRDVTDYARRFGSTIWVQSEPCRTGDERNATMNLIIAADGTEVEGYAGASLPRRTQEADGRWRYTLQVELSGRERSGIPVNGLRYAIAPHDLRTQPLDICFGVSGGNLLGTHRSRPYRIPYARVAEALARAGLPHAAIPGPIAPAP